MDTKLSDKLFKKYKFLRKKDMSSVNCGDGWYGLVDSMCKELKDSGPPKDFVITAIFEKYGELRVHTKNGVMGTRVVVDEYNTKSLQTCDACGNDKELEKCPKCTVPVVVYASPDDATEEDEGNAATLTPATPASGCSGSGSCGGNCSC